MIQEQEKVLQEAVSKIRKYSETSKKYKEFKEKIDASTEIIHNAIRELGVSQKEIQKIYSKDQVHGF